MPQNVRVRFAPSPTGPLHIGGVRTAFYNYLFAKKHQGQFILRIEDTDQNRLVPQSESYIQEALTWLGITPDESPQKGGEMGPYRQSERKSLYEKYALALVKAGKAYYAFDTPEELEAMRAKFKAIGQAAPQYNAISRMQMKNSLTLSQEEVSQRLKQGQPYVIRMLIDPQITIKAKDTIRGWVQVKGVNLDDKVLLKADGMATYHLANVVDDHFMQITHVIRGEEWLPSLAYHILLYEYFQWEKPEFVHLPLLLNANGKGKLSKRNTQQHDFPILPLDWQDAHTQQTLPGFKQAGYLKEALLNFIALLGWHPSHNQELFTCDELIANFSLSRISKSGACFDIDKAKWFNQ
ncbi:MAG: glutamate--tRNA ligase, partial [Bacteroidota bacterium]